MSNTSKFDTLNAELESRLDELFREDAPPTVSAPPAVPASPAMTPDNPLGELKKTVLSIDWEITPETLDSFQDHIRLLKEAFQRDKIISMFLQILGSLGQYVKTSRGNVHPSTFMVLNSVFARLEEILTSPAMPSSVRKKMLQAEMTGYQELRDKVLKRRASIQPSPAGRATAPTPAPARPAPGAAAPPETLAQAIEELKAFIRSELKTLREELRISARRP